METLPEPQDPIKSLLGSFMSDQDVARYSDLSYTIETLKKSELCWQAAVSIGVHAIAVVLGETDDQKGLGEDLAGYALEPMEALYESLTQRPSQKPRTDKQERMFFHLLFGMGFLLLAKGDRQRATQRLRGMAAQLPRRSGGHVRSGPGPVTWPSDIIAGKIAAALVVSFIDLDEDEYEGALYLIKQAAQCAGGRSLLMARGCALIERAAATCDFREWRDEEPDYFFADDAAFDGWYGLLFGAAELLPVCIHADTSGADPGDCETGSAQFLAYKLGQLAATFAMSKADSWERFVAHEEFGWGSADFLLASLICEYEPRRDWQKVRDRYLQRWQRAPACQGAPLDEIGPHMDLYWAMRIGFADKMIESTQALEPVQPPPVEVSVVQDIQAVRDIVSSIALRQLKEEQELDERLPPAKRRIYGFLAECLPGVWERLPAKVINALAKGENYYDTKVNDDDAKVSFVKAVEAGLDDCLVSPLIEFMQQHGRQQIDLPLQPPRNRMGATGLRRLSLLHWADVFDALVTPSRRHLSALAAQDLGRFMDQHIGPRRPDFGPLAQCLRRVQGLRGGSAHYQEAETRIDKEEWELEEIRKLVLGLADSPSVIDQIYHILAPSKES